MSHDLHFVGHKLVSMGAMLMKFIKILVGAEALQPYGIYGHGCQLT